MYSTAINVFIFIVFACTLGRGDVLFTAKINLRKDQNLFPTFTNYSEQTHDSNVKLTLELWI